MKPKLLILQGVPASGKTTFARSLDPTVWVRVNKDDIRRMFGGYMVGAMFDDEKKHRLGDREQFVVDMERLIVERVLYEYKNVVVDDTNLNTVTIDMWKEVAAKFDVEIEFKRFKVSLAEALERNKNREHPINEKWIYTFFHRYEPEEYMQYYTDNRNIVPYDESLDDVVLCDIDGTVALRRGRNPYDYESVGDDAFDPRMKRLLNRFVGNGVRLIFISGRENVGNCRGKTLLWLTENGFCGELLMRAEGDMRPDQEVKKELYEKYIKGHYNVLAVFDDRDKVVKMWREEGLLCPQVYYGDF